MDDYSLEETIQDLPVQQKSLLLALVKLKIPLFRSGGLIKRDVVYPAYCDICRRYDISVLGERRALDLLTNLESNYVISIKKEGRGKNRRLIELDKRIIDNNNLLVYKSYLEKQLSWHQQHI
jgi:Cdc6-like AAA superfamily ATPase